VIEKLYMVLVGGNSVTVSKCVKNPSNPLVVSSFLFVEECMHGVTAERYGDRLCVWFTFTDLVSFELFEELMQWLVLTKLPEGSEYRFSVETRSKNRPVVEVEYDVDTRDLSIFAPGFEHHEIREFVSKLWGIPV